MREMNATQEVLELGHDARANGIVLSCVVEKDNAVHRVEAMFDYRTESDIVTVIQRIPDAMPRDFGIGLICGPSGSGKTTLLSSFGKFSPEWAYGRAIISHFESVEEGTDKLSAVGLNSIPSWVKPYHALSNGEQFRADLARCLGRRDCAVDEFTSIVDRDVAKSCSYALRRYVDTLGYQPRMVLASCHYDIVEWLQPDWVYDTASNQLTLGRSERRPNISIQLFPSDVSAWGAFRHHHYLSGKINKSARCWVAYWGERPVGFVSCLAYPSGTVKHAWREHRTVVLPEFQGLGIGIRLPEAIAMGFRRSGGRFFSKTSHYRVGEYRNASPLWRGTSKNQRARHDYNPTVVSKEMGYCMAHAARVCYSHEFIGGH